MDASIVRLHPLYCSLLGRIAIAAYGIIIALISHSNAALLVGMIQSVETISCVITLIISKKIIQHPDKQFQYGYSKFEPAAINFEALLFILMSAFLILNSVHDLFSAQTARAINVPIVYHYSIITTIISLVIFIIFYAKKKAFQNSLFRSNMAYWAMDSLIALLMTGGFMLATMLNYSSYVAYVIYVDPSLTILLGLLSLLIPIYFYKDSLIDLVDGSPNPQLQTKIQTFIDAILKKPTQDIPYHYTLFMRRAGKNTYLLINPDQKTMEKFNIYQLNLQIVAQLKVAYPDLIVHFTL
jgi:divalent metal cation (Fe/Co/Zn/Cd) transporter